MNKGVSTQHPEYQEYAPVWKKARDCAEGERAIHAATTEYMPRLREETSADYAARVKRTPFFGAYWRTISGLKGMLFRTSPLVSVPAAIESYLEDIDMSGTPLELFTQELAEELLTVGWVGVLIDYPAQAEGVSLSVASAAATGMRPTMQKYKAETIINWKTARINNAQKLTLLVLKESHSTESPTDYGHDAEDRYRELTLTPEGYRQRLFAIRNDKDVLLSETYPLMDGSPLSEIPFVFFGTDSAETEPESPPLEDLMNMNLKHYLVSADYEHGCHLAGLPTGYIAGHNPPEGEKIGLGGLAFHCFPHPQARMAYAEVAGDFGALVTNLESKKSEMAVLGARMLEGQKAGVEAAETIRQRSAGEQSQLAGMAHVISMKMVRALRIFSEWAGATGEISYRLNRDYMAQGLSAIELSALVSSWQAGAISGQTLHANLQRGEIIEQDVSFETEQERINSQQSPV